MSSLYFASLVSYKDDPKFPGSLREKNCFGKSTIQEFYQGKYAIYSLILFAFTIYLLIEIYIYLIGSVAESYLN